MSFKYQRDRAYYLIVKHSGQAVAVHGNNQRLGAPIEQQPLGLTTHGQQVRFQPGELNEYYLLPRISNLPVTVHASLKDVHAPIIQWTNDGGAHQRWRPMYWADGYYHFISVHSGLALEIRNANPGAAQFEQGTLQPGGSHQLFRIEPVVETNLPSTITFQKHTDLLREATLGASGQIPEIGGGLKAVLGVLWPDQHDQDFWNQMVAYVDERIRSAIEKTLLSDMKHTLNGARTNLLFYNELKNLKERAMKLTSIITDLIGNQDKYLYERDNHQKWISIKVLPYLVAYGTLLLCAQAERVRKHSQLFPDQTDEDLQIQIGILETETALFNQAIAEARKQAMQDRLSQIEEKNYNRPVKNHRVNSMNFSTVEDKADGWRAERLHTKYDFDMPASKENDHNAEAHMHTMYLARVAQVTEQFNTELDALLSPARVWRFLNPKVTERPAGEKVTRAIGPYGGTSGLGHTAFSAHAGQLTRLKLCRAYGDKPVLTGMALSYADGTTVTVGHMTAHSEELLLTADEYITNVYGYAGDYIDGITFDTNKGRRLQCLHSQRHCYSFEFVAGVDDGLPKARLTGISGTRNSDNDPLTSMTFHWEYEWKYDWTAAALQAHTATPELDQPAAEA